MRACVCVVWLALPPPSAPPPSSCFLFKLCAPWGGHVTSFPLLQPLPKPGTCPQESEPHLPCSGCRRIAQPRTRPRTGPQGPGCWVLAELSLGGPCLPLFGKRGANRGLAFPGVARGQQPPPRIPRQVLVSVPTVGGLRAAVGGAQPLSPGRGMRFGPQGGPGTKCPQQGPVPGAGLRPTGCGCTLGTCWDRCCLSPYPQGDACRRLGREDLQESRRQGWGESSGLQGHTKARSGERCPPLAFVAFRACVPGLHPAGTKGSPPGEQQGGAPAYSSVYRTRCARLLP